MYIHARAYRLPPRWRAYYGRVIIINRPNLIYYHHHRYCYYCCYDNARAVAYTVRPTLHPRVSERRNTAIVYTTPMDRRTPIQEHTRARTRITTRFARSTGSRAKRTAWDAIGPQMWTGARARCAANRPSSLRARTRLTTRYRRTRGRGSVAAADVGTGTSVPDRTTTVARWKVTAAAGD